MTSGSIVPSACLGIILAFIFSEVFYQSFVSVLKVAAEPVYWTILALSIIFVLYMTSKVKKFVFIISAAFIGSYAIIRVKYI